MIPSPSETDVFKKVVFGEQRASGVRVEAIADRASRILNSQSLLETRNLSLIVLPAPRIILPKKRKPLGLLCAPKLVLDEVTRYLSWEEKTWRQKVIEDTEREMVNPFVGWAVWETYGGAFISRAAADILAATVASMMQLPQEYLDFPAKPPALSGDKNTGG